MSNMLVSIQVDTDINIKTVVIFDPKWKSGVGFRSPHALLLEALFPSGSLFCGVNNFTYSSLCSGRISPLLCPSDLVSLNPLVFIIEMRLLSSFRNDVATVSLIRNIRSEKRLDTVPVVIITDSDICLAQSRQLAILGVGRDRRYSWNALREASEFKQKMLTLSNTGKL